MAYQKYKIPQINSGSSADIAFLLLIFFLITSSLDSRTGIYRKMNATVAGEILKKRKDIQERNLLTFTINYDNQLIYNDESIPFKDVKELSKVFIANPDNSDFLPEKESVAVPEIGVFSITTKHVILLEVSRKAKYQTYISVLNELTAAYNELRNETAQMLFNQPLERLSPEQQEAIRTVYPLQISEREIDSAKERGRYE
jgi:biopolymer transport protein ExbD